MGKVYQGKVEVWEFQGWRVAIHGSQGILAYASGPHDTRERAMRDAAGWLEDSGHVHPTTHDVAK